MKNKNFEFNTEFPIQSQKFPSSFLNSKFIVKIPNLEFESKQKVELEGKISNLLRSLELTYLSNIQQQNRIKTIVINNLITVTDAKKLKNVYI